MPDRGPLLRRLIHLHFDRRLGQHNGGKGGFLNCTQLVVRSAGTEALFSSGMNSIGSIPCSRNY